MIINIPIQPTGLNAYLGTSQIVIPSHLRRLFYTSWEDALWDIVNAKKIKKGAVILVPEFFCGDVVLNMKNHFLKVEWYPCDTNFQTDPKRFGQYIKKLKPSIIVIFHAVGISNKLFSEREIWINKINADTIIIEDSVNRIVDPKKINLIHPNHVVIDSLRKVSPLQGSDLYGTYNFMSFTQMKNVLTFPYSLSIFTASVVFQCLLQLTVLFKRQPIGTIFNRLAEKVMIAVYRLTGSSLQGAPGFWICNVLSRRLDIKKIEECKKRQVSQYKRGLVTLWKSHAFFKISVPSADEGLLRGFPIGIHILKSNTIKKYLRKNNFLALFELNECPWSNKQKVIYLPLGPHVSDDEIKFVIQLLKKSTLL